MIAVNETIDGTPSSPPLAAVEGVSSGLFDAGHIVFDAGVPAPSAKEGDLRHVAHEGGATWILRVSVAYTQTKLEDGVTRVTGSASFALVNTATGATSVSDRVSVTNSGREKMVDRVALGRELGRLVSQWVLQVLPTPSL